MVEANSPAAYDELLLEVVPLWRTRTVRVRIADRSVEQVDVDQLDERAATSGDAECVLIAPIGHAEGLSLPPRVTLIDATELIARLERSASIGWSEDLPTPAFDRMAAFRDLEEQTAVIDRLGLRWLPILALNELPVELAGAGIAPQDLLERVVFRLLTATFRFGGQRYGESARGERLPDSVAILPQPRLALAALVDCKAASAGYVMEADHALRFERYIADAREPLSEQGLDLAYLVIVSSDFPGRAGNAHPYFGRADAFRSRSHVKLVYLKAMDLARLAVAVEAAELDPASRLELDWRGLFEHGLIDSNQVDTLIEELA